MLCGGFNAQPRQADDEIVTQCNEVRSEVETRLGRTFGVWEPHSYVTQVVAGTNYKVKVHVGDNTYVHIKYFRPLPHAGTALQLTEASEGHAVDTAL